MASDKFEDLLYEALTEQYQYGDGGHGGTELDKPIIAYVDGLENRIIELEGKIKDFRKRAVHAEAAVKRMLKWGKKYVSEAWDEHDERVERKQAWDEIVAKYTGEFEE